MTRRNQSQTDNDKNLQESPPETPAPPGNNRNGKKGKSTVACLAIRDFNHDSVDYRAAWSEVAGPRTINHAPSRLKLDKAWADHHIKEGNVVLERDYDGWLAKQAKAEGGTA